MKTDPREARLPKWAQEELRSLRMQLSKAKRSVEELKGQNPGSDTFLLDYGSLDDFPLPQGARIAYHLTPPGCERRVRQSIQVYSTGDELHIQGDSSLIIHPRASNSFNIELERYR